MLCSRTVHIEANNVSFNLLSKRYIVRLFSLLVISYKRNWFGFYYLNLCRRRLFLGSSLLYLVVFVPPFLVALSG
jgi:hypothetical protein